MGRKPKNQVKYTVPDNSYLHIEAFMVNDLHLSGNELIIYAIIFGFSQDGQSWFTGSRKYLSGWCQITEESVTYNLNKLIEKGLIECREKQVHDMVFKDYRVSLNILGVGEKLVPLPEKPVPEDEKPDPPIEKPILHTIEHTIASYDSPHTKENASASTAKKAFQKPTLEAVTAYCKERNNDIDPQYFLDYQDARGWVLKGGQKMRDWKAVIRTWERMAKKYSNGQTNSHRQQQIPEQDLSDFTESRKYWEEYVPEGVQ